MFSKHRLLTILGIFLLLPLLASCSGTTAQIRVTDVDVERRPFALVPYPLETIDVSSGISSFNSGKELNNLQQSIKKILKRANLFGDDASKPYALKVRVEDFDIPQGTMGAFDSTLSIAYQLTDASGKVLFDDLVESSGADDTGSFLGPVRQNHSRTMAVAENLQLFVESLSSRLAQGSGIAADPNAASYTAATGTKGLRPKITKSTLPPVQLLAWQKPISNMAITMR